MSQITLRQLPPEVEEQIRILARQRKTSINRTIISLLQASLGVEDAASRERRLLTLSGTWQQRDGMEFAQAMSRLRGA